MLRTSDNFNPHALYFWGRYTDALMQQFEGDAANFAFMNAHLSELREKRRVA